MTLKEKIGLVKSAGEPSGLIAAAKVVEEPCIVGYDFAKKHAYIKRDLRAEIKAKAKAEGVSLRQVANAIGVDYINFYKYIQGERGLTYDKVEELVALLS